MSATAPITLTPREEQVFPFLTAAQIARLQMHETRRTVQRGEVLLEAGAQVYPSFVVVAGALEVVRNVCAGGEEIATTHRQGQFSETSLPGVFAIGDVRGGNIKRVASAVGEGSIAIAFVHQVLRE